MTTHHTHGALATFDRLSQRNGGFIEAQKPFISHCRESFVSFWGGLAAWPFRNTFLVTSPLLRRGPLGHSYACATRARESLDRHDLEVVGVAETMLGPEVEMVAGRHRAGRALALAHGPILRKCAGASDGWLVDTRVGADLVGAAVGLEGAEVRGSRARVVVSVVLDNVVLGLGRVDPAVDGEVGARVGGVVCC